MVVLNATAAGFGVATGPVLIDETRCVGDETRLINCRHNGVGTLNCDHSRDVGLRCRIRKYIVMLCGHDFKILSITSRVCVCVCVREICTKFMSLLHAYS